MYEKILHEMRARVRGKKIAVNVHSRREMYKDDLLLADVKNCILNGAIVERQWDEDFLGYKYVIEGPTTERGEYMHTVAKLGSEHTVVITVYRVL